MLRRVISIFLSVLIAFSVIVIPASADEIKTITVHYFNESNWTQPYIYYYYGSNTGDSWPGNAMSSEGNGWYTYKIYNYSTAYVIFSDNGANQNPAQNEQGFQVTDEMWYYKGNWSLEKPESISTIVHYYNENNWSAPYIYYYSDNSNPITWPGNAMISEGGNWYTYTIPDIASPKVVFSNNGTHQNPAQNNPGFDVSGEKWYLNGTFHDSEPEGITVHYHNYDNWNNVNIYYYDGERTGNDWTGNPMTSDGDGWYTYKIYGFESVKVLFNNGGNIQIPGQYEPGFDVSGEMWYRNGEWTTERPDEITIYFYKPDDWGTPNIYYYKNNNDTGSAWPGEQMTSEGDNWYSFTITKYDEANVLFNSNSNQIPAQNQPGLDASDIMFYKDGFWCDTESDIDNDDLPDFMEMILGTAVNNSDSDGDGLPDGLEVLILGTDPLKADSDENGVNDGAEDADNDGLTNLQEYTLGTDPTSSDSDEDGLSDGDEVNTYHTNPLKVDTDDDGLSDYDEVQLGLNPLSEDTNGDGILDCDEKIQQTINEKIICEDKSAVTGVTVSFAGTGNIQTTTTIDNIYNIDMSSSGVVGLVGAPVEINSTSQFDSAVITFSYDETELGDVPEENLSIMWYDEENDLYIILDQDSVVDSVNNTVSYTTTHFSKYMLVDKQQWYDTWKLSIDYRSGSYNPTYYDFSFVVDTSGSMSGNRIDCAKTALNNFIDCLSENDHAGLVQFDSNASIVCSMGTSKQSLKNGVNSLLANGGTRVSQGLSAGINQLMSYNTGNQKVIILICDGDVDDVSSVVDIAYNNNIIIYTINVVAANVSALQSMAERTGGEYYFASDSSDLINRLSEICGDMLYHIDFSDYDNDGLPDVFERSGMRLSNGRIICTDPYNSDTDGDGVLDGQEVAALSLGSGINITIPNWNVFILPNGAFYIGNGEYRNSDVFFNLISNPNQDDSDNDGLLDCEDPFPNCFNTYVRYDRGKVMEYCDTYAKLPNKEVYGYFDSATTGDCANFASQCLYSGGIQMNKDWYFKNIGYEVSIFGETHYILDDYSDTWINAYLNYNYFKNNSQICNNQVIEFSSKEEMEAAIRNNDYNIQPGDLMYMEWNIDEKKGPTHATIIDGIDNDTITFSAHTLYRHTDDVNECFWKGYSNGRLYILTIKDLIITS